MNAAILRGMSQDSNLISQQLPHICTSGNCTFEPFNSLGVCSACHDVTMSLRKGVLHNTAPLWILLPGMGDMPLFRADNLTKFSLPDRNELWNTDAYFEAPDSNIKRNDDYQVSITVKGNFNVTETVSFRDDNLLIFAMTMIKANFTSQLSDKLLSWPDVPVTATECGLSFCVRRVHCLIRNGELTERMEKVSTIRNTDSWQPLFTDEFWIIREHPLFSYKGLQSEDDHAHWFSRTDLEVSQLNDPRESFNVSQVSIDSMKSGFSETFRMGSYILKQPNNTNAIILLNSTSKIMPTTNVMQSLWVSPNITERFETLAVSMTNQMRQDDDNQSMVLGITTSSVTIIRVQWGWMVLPVSLVILGCVFLFFSARKSRQLRQPIWKEDSLAILFHGLEGLGLETQKDLSTAQDMTRYAKATTVQLLDRDDRIRLGRSCFLHGIKGTESDYR